MWRAALLALLVAGCATTPMPEPFDDTPGEPETFPEIAPEPTPLIAARAPPAGQRVLPWEAPPPSD
jgi:hypothetical protein